MNRIEEPGDNGVQMEKGDDKLLSEIRHANPVDRAEFDDWVREEGEEFLRARVFSRSAVTSHGRHMRLPHGLAWAAAVAVVVIGAAILSWWLLTSEPIQTVDEEKYQPRVEEVSYRDSLARLVSLVDAQRGYGQPWFYGVTSDLQLVDRAVTSGLLTRSEAVGLNLDDPVNRGEFALWLWRVFGPQLARVHDMGLRDGESPWPEEREAITGLVRAGVLTVFADGSFQAARPLSPEEEQMALRRVSDILGLEPPD